jgi:4-hydroxy-tetrahydrodipicolinate synthase
MAVHKKLPVEQCRFRGEGELDSAGMKTPTPIPIWSAVPTPLTPDLKVDEASVARMVAAAVSDGVEGLFIAGTCGEGPWLPDRERRRLMDATVQAAAGRLKIATQVTDNSVPRILDNAAVAAAAGIDYAIIAPPATMLNATPERITALFEEAAAACPLPVGIYDLGRHRPVMIPEGRLKQLYLLPQVRFVKDSSGSPERRAIAVAARAEKPTLRLFNGDEFRCLEYLQAGYDGFIFGGAVAVGPLLRRISELFIAGQLDEAQAVDAEIKKTLFGIYGGESIGCWLTGLKYYLVRRGLFTSAASFLGYPLTGDCRAFIDRLAADDAARQEVLT